MKENQTIPDWPPKCPFRVQGSGSLGKSENLKISSLIFSYKFLTKFYHFVTIFVNLKPETFLARLVQGSGFSRYHVNSVKSSPTPAPKCAGTS